MKAFRRMLGLGLTILMLTGTVAEASFPPTKIKLTRKELAEMCDGFGSSGIGKGLISTGGSYSCENTETGDVIECEADGNCTIYFTDPELKKKIAA
ncbi:MAG: hypothetical protein AB7F76_07185 [Parvibaculaceae bacterium]|jgi:hypothetical protein